MILLAFGSALQQGTADTVPRHRRRHSRWCQLARTCERAWGRVPAMDRYSGSAGGHARDGQCQGSAIVVGRLPTRPFSSACSGTATGTSWQEADFARREALTYLNHQGRPAHGVPLRPKRLMPGATRHNHSIAVSPFMRIATYHSGGTSVTVVLRRICLRPQNAQHAKSSETAMTPRGGDAGPLVVSRVGNDSARCRKAARDQLQEMSMSGTSMSTGNVIAALFKR